MTVVRIDRPGEGTDVDKVKGYCDDQRGKGRRSTDSDQCRGTTTIKVHEVVEDDRGIRNSDMMNPTKEIYDFP